MSMQDYEKAYKLGKKEYQYCMMHGENGHSYITDGRINL